MATTTTTTGVAGAFVDALVARDVTRAVALLDPAVDFRAMTPNRVWEAADAAEVATILHAWFEDPDEVIHGVEGTEPTAVQDTLRVGWLVRVDDEDGVPYVFEQQAYVRDDGARIVWMRAMCSGWRPLA